MGGGSKTKETTNQQTNQTVQLPAWMSQAGQQLWNDASKAAKDNPVAGYTGPMAPGQSQNQQAAGELARANVGAGRPDLQTARDMTAAAATGGYPTAQAGNVTAATMGAAQQGTHTQAQAPTVTANNVTAGQFDQAALDRYRNPNLEAVQGRTLAEMQRQGQMQMQDVGDRAQAARAFGGDRHAVLEAELGKGVNANMLDYVASSNKDAYDDAFNRFTADRNATMQADLANQGANLTADTTTASFLDQMLGRNQAALNASETANADRRQGAGEFNASSANTVNTGNADRNYDASKTNAGLGQNFLDRLLSAGDQFGKISEADTNLGTRDINNLLATGEVAQGAEREQLQALYNEFLRMQDAPMERYRDLGAILAGTPRDITTTGTAKGTTTTQQSGGLLNQLLGGAQIAASVFSDRRLKRDVRLVDRLADGLGLYRFRYLWSDEERTGVMADEVARLRPDALGATVLGFATVNYDKLGVA